MLDFWIRRWLRTLPNYFLVLTILMIMATLILKMDLVAHLNYYWFSQNLYTPHPEFFPDAWSLTVEEWFYFFVPLIIFILCAYAKVSLKNSVGFTILLIIVFCTAVRWYRHIYGPEMTSFDHWDLVYRKQIITRLDSIMYGVLVAYIRYYFPVLWNKKVKLLFIIGLLLAAFDHVYLYITRINHLEWDLYTNVLSFNVLCVATMLMIPYLCTIKQSSALFFRVLTFVSIISYSIYLLNLNMVQLIFMPFIIKIVGIFLHGKLFLLAKYGIYWFLTISLGTLLYKYFESKVMNLRDKVDLHVKTQHVD
jgi:peptidoglycan/LPS O-acetylase OafA/YrhL